MFARVILGLVATCVSADVLAAPCAGFVDVDSNSAFCPSVAWVKSRAITLGCIDASHYCPNDPVTRLQMAAFLYRLGFQNAVLSGGNAFGTTAVIGTTDNNAVEINVNGGRVVRYEPNATSPNVVSGLANNNVPAGVYGAAVSGGGAGGTQFSIDLGGIIETSDCTVPAGGSCGNWVLDAFGVIGGGVANRAGNGTGIVTDGGLATVGGGYQNSAIAAFSTVAGGESNTASDLHANVAGGWFNKASGARSSVGGGYANLATGNSSVVVGGNGNVASGYAAVAGGANSLAGGFASVALGWRAKAYVDGSFVFSDSSYGDFSSGIPNEFLVGATGGIGMYTAKDYTTGCHINARGGSWLCSSSREVKRDFEAVDSSDVLVKVAMLPISTWRFSSEDVAVRHLGPMADDFRHAFGLGIDDRTIATVDANGVALAAIQGLNVKVDEQAREIAQLKRLLEEVLMARAASEGRIAGR